MDRFNRTKDTARVRRIAAALIIVAAVAAGVTAHTQAVVRPTLSAAVQSHLRAEKFQVVTAVRGLPLGVREELERMFGVSATAIAEPGARFQATDDLSEPGLPIRRLNVAGCSQDHCLVYYERGGIARVWHAVLFHWTPEGTRVVAGGIAPAGLRSVDELRDAVLTGRLKAPGQYW